MDFTRDRRLAELAHPTLILRGCDNNVNHPSGAASLASRLRNADVFMFANTGHQVQWEALVRRRGGSAFIGWRKG